MEYNRFKSHKKGKNVPDKVYEFLHVLDKTGKKGLIKDILLKPRDKDDKGGPTQQYSRGIAIAVT